MLNDQFKKIPGVDSLLNQHKLQELAKQFGAELVTHSIREILKSIRERVVSGGEAPELETIIDEAANQINFIAGTSLKPVINATGIILHTNLGRAPVGDDVAKEIIPILSSYSNLEFNLQTGKRGKRNDHISELIKFVTNAEDAVIVNNNAAAVLLCLNTLAKGKEVIISRGELIEIGGSFRLPEIMEASGAVMIEVGTTNRTRIADYENAITENTKILLKAHLSNYYMGGFTEEVGITELAPLAQKHNLILVYDIGSGLLTKHPRLPLEDEPDVRTSLKTGADLVTFSCDKLLCGPQAGIVAGRKELISRLAKAPLMRAIRVDKMTIAALSSVLRYHLNEDELYSKVPAFSFLTRTSDDLKILAEKLLKELQFDNINAEIVNSEARTGGGSLPRLEINSYAVMITHPNDDKFGERIYYSLLKSKTPIVAILRKGNILFDVITLFEGDIPLIAKAIKDLL